ncbi:hypothetical protein H7X68_03250 [Candidatus Saccharibacteria bacterium]|nr:hypothetical protein [Candidatus Saccharibacteria bacterium]
MYIYFSGIGGVGLGPLAEIAHDAGYQVVGSDLGEGLMSEKLQTHGIQVHIGQDGSFLQSTHDAQPIDLFVYTAALQPTHPELVLAKQLGIRVAKRDELLAQIISEKNLKIIAVSGTHGKTTATGMIVWILQQLNIPISYSIGSTIDFGPSGHFDSKSEYFAYECDEFDRNFLHFSPYLSIVTSLDHDHADTFPTEADYLNAFTQFASQSRQVIAWNDQHPEVFDGLSQVSLLDPSHINQRINVAGLHNRRNATLVQTALGRLGFSQDTDSIVSNFPGTDRRFEKLADNLYSDYGHHPVEIAATLQLAREISDQVVLVYQPHQNVRQYDIKDEYVDKFELAEKVYWLPTYLSRENPDLPILQPEELIKNITNKDDIHIVDFNNELWDIIQTARNEGKLVLGMGAGAIDGWLRAQIGN